MAKKTKNKFTGMILALAAIVAAALVIKYLWNSGVNIPRPGTALLSREAGGPNAFADSLAGLKDDSLAVRQLTVSPDSGTWYQIAAGKDVSYILLNLRLSRMAGSCGLKTVAAEEDSKKQTLKLSYAFQDTQTVNVLVKRKRSEIIPAAAKPRMAIVIYNWPPQDPKTAQEFLNCPQAGTLIIKAAAKNIAKTVLAALPLEPKGYPRQDPGPGTILVDDSDIKIKSKMDQALKLYPKAAGFYAVAGSRALEDSRVCNIVLKYCLQKGLIFLEPQPSTRSLASELAGQLECRYVKPDLVIENKDSRSSVAAQLNKALAACREKGRYVVLAPASPAFIKALKETVGEKTKNEFDFISVSKIGQ
ncbi:MAG: divergent polysaccharide deacetylase family protein [bacterium]|nr:divergent polysaccharide deacetylase family protein [bacterium]